MGLEYNRFLKEYLGLGHMTQVEPYAGDHVIVFYLQHQLSLRMAASLAK